MSWDEAKLAWLRRYGGAGMRIFPVNARRHPLVEHWRVDASSDPEVIKTWLLMRPYCDFGWSLPADVAAADVDRKNGKNGYRDFRDRAGCDPQDVS
jgi:hypothetical protein